MRSPRVPGRWLWITALAALFVLGTYHRTRGFGDLILLSDEIHAVQAARSHTLLECFTYYGEADNSIPVTMYARFLLQLGWLSETPLRLPILVAGLLLILTPLLFSKRLGAGATFIAVGLFATSPVLIYFSFVARPYGIALLLSMGALCAWERWIAGGGRRERIAFSVAASLAVFFHLFSAFMVAGLLLATPLAVRAGRVRWRALFETAGLTLFLGLVLMGPGLPNLLAAHGGKVGGGALDQRFFLQLLRILSGFIGPVAWVLLLAMVTGLVLWWRKDPVLGAGATATLACFFGGILWLQPEGLTIDYSRYFLLAWPLALLLTASGLEGLFRCVRTLTRWRFAALGVGLFIILMLTRKGTIAHQLGVLVPEMAVRALLSWGALAILAAGLLTGIVQRFTTENRRPLVQAIGAVALGLAFAIGVIVNSHARVLTRGADSFRTHRMAIMPEGPRILPLPQAYSTLDPADTGALIEAPFTDLLHRWVPYEEYQREHGRRVILGQGADYVNNLYSGFRNVIDTSDPSRVRENGARFLVVHRDLASEFEDAGRSELLLPDDRGRFASDAVLVSASAREHWGEPVFLDGRFEVYDLRR